MINKLSDKDKKDWQDFLDSSEKLQVKDVDQLNNKVISEKSIDLHGYTLEEANKQISKFIENCFVNKVKKIKIDDFNLKNRKIITYGYIIISYSFYFK